MTHHCLNAAREGHTPKCQTGPCREQVTIVTPGDHYSTLGILIPEKNRLNITPRCSYRHLTTVSNSASERCAVGAGIGPKAPRSLGESRDTAPPYLRPSRYAWEERLFFCCPRQHFPGTKVPNFVVIDGQNRLRSVYISTKIRTQKMGL